MRPEEPHRKGKRFKLEPVKRLHGRVPSNYDEARAQSWHLLEQEGIELPAEGLERHPDWIKLTNLLHRGMNTHDPIDARETSRDLGEHLKSMKAKYGKE
jgi:hypothetical protein